MTQPTPQGSAATRLDVANSLLLNPKGGTLSRLDLHQLPGDKAVYACAKCSEVLVGPSARTRGRVCRLPSLTHSPRSFADAIVSCERNQPNAQALQDELVSQAFTGRSGRA
jgi:hypothetical protein